MESHSLHALAYATNFWKGSLRTFMLLGSVASINMFVSPVQAYTLNNPQYGNLSHNVTQTKKQIEQMNQLEQQSQKLSKLLPPMQKPLLKEIARLTLLSSQVDTAFTSEELNAAQTSKQQSPQNAEQSQVREENSSIELDLSTNSEPNLTINSQTGLTKQDELTNQSSLTNQAELTNQSNLTNQPALTNQSNLNNQPIPIAQQKITNKPLLLIFGADKFYTFLGCANCAPDEALSIWNPYGPYGSHKSQYSIWSDGFEFGNASAQVSPWNPYGRQPPFLIDSMGQVHGRLSINPNSQNANRGILASFLYQNYEQIRLDPKAWFYELFSNSKHAVLTVPETQTNDQQPVEINQELLPDEVLPPNIQ